MAVNDFIKIDTSTVTATHAQRLKNAVIELRRAIDDLIFLRKTMEHMTDEASFTLIEELFGVAPGKGATVYALVNNSVSTAAKNLTEQVG